MIGGRWERRKFVATIDIGDISRANKQVMNGTTIIGEVSHALAMLEGAVRHSPWVGAVYDGKIAKANELVIRICIPQDKGAR